jgi:hypothetical protein
MAVTTRKDILDNMIYRLGQIWRITTVCRRDIDAEPFDPEECPALNIETAEKAKITHNVSDDEHELPITITLHTTTRITVDTIEELLGDVSATIVTNDTWGGHADGTNIESHGVDTNQSGDVIQSATLDITVNYTTAKGKI